MALSGAYHERMTRNGDGQSWSIDQSLGDQVAVSSSGGRLSEFELFGKF